MFLVGFQNPCIAKHAVEICSTLQFSQKNREVPQESTKLQVGWEDILLIIFVSLPLAD